MQQYFQISKAFMMIITGVFFAAAITAIASPVASSLHKVAVSIGTITLITSPGIAIATLITAIGSIREKLAEKDRFKRKMNEFSRNGFTPDNKRVEYILSHLEPEDRAYLEYYYAMQHEPAAQAPVSMRLKDTYVDDTQALQHQAS